MYLATLKHCGEREYKLKDGLVLRRDSHFAFSTSECLPLPEKMIFISQSGRERQLSISQRREDKASGGTAVPGVYTPGTHGSTPPQQHPRGFISSQCTKSGSSELISCAALLLYQQRIISKECFSNAAVLNFRGTLNLA